MSDKIKCTQLSADYTSDWCLLEATQGSLREHMKLLNDAYKELDYRAEIINTRDGTIKQLQERVRKLEETKNITHAECCECRLCSMLDLDFSNKDK